MPTKIPLPPARISLPLISCMFLGLSDQIPLALTTQALTHLISKKRCQMPTKLSPVVGKMLCTPPRLSRLNDGIWRPLLFPSLKALLFVLLH